MKYRNIRPQNIPTEEERFMIWKFPNQLCEKCGKAFGGDIESNTCVLCDLKKGRRAKSKEETRQRDA